MKEEKIYMKKCIYMNYKISLESSKNSNSQKNISVIHFISQKYFLHSYIFFTCGCNCIGDNVGPVLIVLS